MGTWCTEGVKRSMAEHRREETEKDRRYSARADEKWKAKCETKGICPKCLQKVKSKIGKSEIYWAITGEFGLYIGVWRTRIEAIIAHADSLGKTWQECRKKGDRAIKVIVAPLESEAE